MKENSIPANIYPIKVNPENIMIEIVNFSSMVNVMVRKFVSFYWAPPEM